MIHDQASLTLFLFGAPRLEQNGRSVPINRRKVMALLAYLTVTNQTHTRDALAALLWPHSNAKRAYGSLRRCLSLAKKAVGNKTLAITRETIGLKPEAAVWIDLAEFRRCLTAVHSHDHAPGELCSTCRDHLAQAADLYQGDFLAGFSLSNTPEFDAWQFWQADALRQDFEWVLEKLVTFHVTQSAPEEAIPYARRRAALNPLCEPAQQQLIRLYAATGQLTVALRQYKLFAQQLEGELSTSPSVETQALAQQIRASAAGERPPQQDSREKALPASNLPAPALPFVGQAQALQQINEWLDQPDCRLITITGFGDVGKTRLALQAAAQQAAQQVNTFPHGVYFVPLETAASPTDFINTLAGALPFTWRSDMPGKEQLFQALRQLHMLLVLDNCEQLTAVAGVLSEMLAAVPGLRLLVTSRCRLGLQEEWLLPLSGLPFPTEADEDPGAYPAVQLFLQQARRIQPGFHLSAAIKPHVIRICQLVEGLPLGIELAASWTRLLSCREIADAIASNQTSVASPHGNVPARHRSLQAVCDYSWQMLSTLERRATRQLGVFRGGFTREAAQAVAGTSLPLLLSLVDHSLLQCRAPERDDGGANGRFHMHPVVHQYAENRLSQHPDEVREVRASHGRYYAQFLQEREAALRGGRQGEALAQIRAELPNVRVAWRWALDHKEAPAVAQALDALFFFYFMKGFFRQGIDDFEQALSIWPPQPAGRLSARLLIRQGHLYLCLSHIDAATVKLKTGLRLLTDCREESAFDVALAQSGLGALALRAGRLHEAQCLYQECLATFRTLGDTLLQARTLSNLGRVAGSLGKIAAAQRLDEAALALYRQIDNPLAIATSLNNLSHYAQTVRDYTGAEKLLQESLQIARTLRSHWLIATVLSNLSHVSKLQNRSSEAANYLQESLTLRTRYTLSGVVITQEELARLAGPGYRI